MVIGLILFAALGLALGYALPGRAAWLALLAPIAFALLTAFSQGIDGRLILVLVIALALTAAAIVVGRLLDRRSAERSAGEGAS